jgi:hypothetical protein
MPALFTAAAAAVANLACAFFVKNEIALPCGARRGGVWQGLATETGGGRSKQDVVAGSACRFGALIAAQGQELSRAEGVRRVLDQALPVAAKSRRPAQTEG